MQTSDELSRITRDLGITLTRSETLSGSLSGAQVYAVALPGGTRAVLKISDTTVGPARDAAERELYVYLHLRDDLGIRTPQLLDHRDSSGAIAILLTAHSTPRPATAWAREHWLHLADDLARLHQTPVPVGPQWRRASWLAASLENPDLAAAEAFWCWPGERQLLAPILGDPTVLHDAITCTGDCFVHGDCHTDNILMDERQLIWTDWQGAGAGSPAAELAFPSVRATPAGASMPQQQMIHRYAAARGLDASRLSRATLAAELATFLFTWPEYASDNTDDGVRRVHRRVRQLIRTWLDTSQ